MTNSRGKKKGTNVKLVTTEKASECSQEEFLFIPNKGLPCPVRAESWECRNQADPASALGRHHTPGAGQTQDGECKVMQQIPYMLPTCISMGGAPSTAGGVQSKEISLEETTPSWASEAVNTEEGSGKQESERITSDILQSKPRKTLISAVKSPTGNSLLSVLVYESVPYESDQPKSVSHKFDHPWCANKVQFQNGQS